MGNDSGAAAVTHTGVIKLTYLEDFIPPYSIIRLYIIQDYCVVLLVLYQTVFQIVRQVELHDSTDSIMI